MKSKIGALALMAVILGGVALPAQPIPPVILDFRSPIVANDTPDSPDLFVFPDALNLINSAVDPDGTVVPSGILWSYTTNDTYELNATLAINLSNPNFDPNNPGVRRLGVFGTDDPAQEDNDPRTLTIRNRRLSPRSGAPTAVASGTGILSEQTRVITLIASDGTTWSKTSFIAYTSKGGADRYQGISEESPVITPSSAGDSPWRSINVFGTTHADSPGNGLCISTGLQETGFGIWESSFRAINLVKDNVYRIRINVQSTEDLPAGSTPIWDFVVDNVWTDNGTLVHGSQNKYSTDWINWDTHGGANSVGQQGSGRRTFDLWWAPLPVRADDWNSFSGEFNQSNDPYNDARFQFRVLDIDSAVDGADGGAICFKSYQVDRFDIHDFAVAETTYDVAAPVGELANGIPGFQNESANMTVRSIFNSVALDNTAGLTVRPINPGTPGDPTLPPITPGSWGQVEIVEIDPGDDHLHFTLPTSVVDNWPIAWNSNELVRITVRMKAADATGESNPPDVIRILMDTPTSEFGMDSLVSAGANLIGMPKEQSVTTYTAFFHTQNRTASHVPQFAGLRPRVSLLMTREILSGGLNVNNGGVTLLDLKVEKLFPVN